MRFSRSACFGSSAISRPSTLSRSSRSLVYSGSQRSGWILLERRRRAAVADDGGLAAVAAAIAEPLPEHLLAGDLVGPHLRRDVLDIALADLQPPRRRVVVHGVGQRLGRARNCAACRNDMARSPSAGAAPASAGRPRDRRSARRSNAARSLREPSATASANSFASAVSGTRRPGRTRSALKRAVKAGCAMTAAR